MADQQCEHGGRDERDDDFRSHDRPPSGDTREWYEARRPGESVNAWLDRWKARAEHG